MGWMNRQAVMREQMNPLNRPVYQIRYTADMAGRRFWLWHLDKWIPVWITGHDGEGLMFEEWRTGETRWKRIDVMLALCPRLTDAPGPGRTDAIYDLRGGGNGEGKFPDIIPDSRT